jgi:hypothetical protein
MDALDLRTSAPGGRAANGGCFHMSFRSGSRASGACASAAHDYVTRSDEYADRGLDEAVYAESGNMPSWAEDAPADFWDAADLYERANGRLYVSADFTLPVGLDRDDQVALAREFVADLTGDERLPYTMAVHAGRDADGVEHNPHVHLMFSERQNDGIERSPKEWFRRANSQHPERGGAPKSRTFHGPAWIEKVRANWAGMTNRTLERLGREERVDHRSYVRQGIDREPGQHFGPAAAHMAGRGVDHERLADASAERDQTQGVPALDREIAQLEAEIEHLRLDSDRDRQRERGTQWGGGSGWSRGSDSPRER